MDVIVIFDIGKINKKFFFFDLLFWEVYCVYFCFEEIKDDDGDVCDDLQCFIKWMRDIFVEVLVDFCFNICCFNFLIYGVSFVYIDEDGNLVILLYNYFKFMLEKML